MAVPATALPYCLLLLLLSHLPYVLLLHRSQHLWGHSLQEELQLLFCRGQRLHVAATVARTSRAATTAESSVQLLHQHKLLANILISRIESLP
jgi:hypothetical protein